MFGKKDTRRKVSLSERSSARLDYLMKVTDADSPTELLRYAIRIYEQVIEWELQGHTFALVTPSSDVVPVRIFAEQDTPDSGPPKRRFEVIDGGRDQ